MFIKFYNFQHYYQYFLIKNISKKMYSTERNLTYQDTLEELRNKTLKTYVGANQKFKNFNSSLQTTKVEIKK
jgi:hypothetical protein